MKISVRQICFIMLAYTAASKLLLYPSNLSLLCGRDLLFPALINFGVQAVIIWAVSYLCSRTDKTFFQLIEGTLGNITARIIYGLFALFFILCTIIPLFEQKLYVHAIFYDTVPSLLVFLPFFFLAVYAATKGFENIGRCADICLPVFIVTMIFIFGMSVLEVKWDSILPMLKSPAKSVLGGTAASLFRFAEPCYLLMFMGRFKYKKGDAAKITLSYIGGAVIVLFFLYVFYGVYGGIASSRPFAVSKISVFFPAMEMLGRIDLVALYALEVVMLFALILNIQLAVHAIETCTGYDNKAVLSVAVNGALIIILCVFDHFFSNIYSVYSKWMWIAFILFANVLPLLAWAMRRRDRR